MGTAAFWRHFAEETVRHAIHLTVVPELDQTYDGVPRDVRGQLEEARRARPHSDH